MDSYYTLYIILIISSVEVVSCEAEPTPAAPSCTMNGRFADLSDPCGQSYIVCLWTGSSFLTLRSKCPNKLVFNQITSMCVRSTKPLPAICEPTTTAAIPDTTTALSTAAASTPAAPACVMNGRFADPSDVCGQTYIFCLWDDTQFLSWMLKCPNSLVFFQITSECVVSKTTLPPSCAPLATTDEPDATPTLSSSMPSEASETPITTSEATETSTITSEASGKPTTTSETPEKPTITSEASEKPTTTSETPEKPSTTSKTPQTTLTTTTAATPSCVMNGRFADLSDPCGQTYIVCSWDGSKFLMWKLKCPNKLVFYQITAKCVRSTTALPSTC